MAFDTLQSGPNSATATVLNFPGAWGGPFEPSEAEAEARANALNDARHIIAAKQADDTWTATMLVGMLAAMDKPHLLRLELAIGTHAKCSDATRQALALIRVANGGKDHRKLVSAAVEALQGRQK